MKIWCVLGRYVDTEYGLIVQATADSQQGTKIRMWTDNGNNDVVSLRDFTRYIDSGSLVFAEDVTYASQ